jgi:hypothetical protein
MHACMHAAPLIRVYKPAGGADWVLICATVTAIFIAIINIIRLLLPA